MITPIVFYSDACPLDLLLTSHLSPPEVVTKAQFFIASHESRYVLPWDTSVSIPS